MAEFGWTSETLPARIELAVGDVGRVAVAERPSTGYRWECTTDAPAVATCLVARPGVERGAPPGSERRVEVVLTAVAAGVARVGCSLRRPWGGEPAASLGVEVRVTTGER